MTTTVTRTAATTAPADRGATGVLKRWPSLLAVALAATLLGGGDLGDIIEGWGGTLVFLPLLYLIVAKLDRPRASWPVLAVGMAFIFGLQALDVVPVSVFFAGVAVTALVWSAVGEDTSEPGLLRLEVLGMIGFGTIAFVGLAVEPNVGRYVVAGGWLLHGVWDFVHLRLGKVVVRSYAEWCGVLDILVGLQLALLV